MNLQNFLLELKRRRIYSVAAAYVVAGWLLIQIATQVFPFFAIPDWIVRFIVLLLIVGFPGVVVGTWAFAQPSATPLADNEGERKNVRATGRKLAALVLLLATVAAGLMVFRFVRSSAKKAPAPATASASKSIAVLPFTNLSEDKANAYFVLGMRDEIVTSLAQLRDLDVRSRTSAEKYRSHPDDVRTIGRDLGVASVLEGSVQKADADVLINVQLIDAQSRDQLWAQSYRRTVKDVFSVQGEVAQQVADALKIKLAPAQARRLLSPPTTNARAHDLYLRAHALGAHADEQSLLGKIALLKKAVTDAKRRNAG